MPDASWRGTATRPRQQRIGTSIEQRGSSNQKPVVEVWSPSKIHAIIYISHIQRSWLLTRRETQALVEAAIQSGPFVSSVSQETLKQHTQNRRSLVDARQNCSIEAHICANQVLKLLEAFRQPTCPYCTSSVQISAKASSYARPSVSRACCSMWSKLRYSILSSIV